jgi:hypothetical protein
VTPTPNPATTGDVSYFVNVSDPSDVGIPTGSVSVSDGASGSCGIAVLDGTGSGTCAIEEPVGSFTITASYSGDTNYDPNTVTASETVNPATPVVTVTPQSGAKTGLVTYGVSVAGPAGAVVPSGSVSVSDGTNSCNVTALSGTGTGSCSISEGAGSYTATATYPGDSNYATANGSAGETVAKATPTVTPSGPAGTVTAGSITYSVVVAGTTGAPVATGSVVVTDAAGGTCTIPLSGGTGQCSIFETPNVGGYFLNFVYAGDTNYLGSHAHFTQKVGYAPTTVTVTPNKNPALVTGTGTVSVKYTVSLSSTTGLPSPTGTAIVTDGAGNSCKIAKFTAGIGACSITEGWGSYSVGVSYSGDGNYTSGTGSVTEYVATKTLTVFSASPNPVASKGSVTLTATVTSDYPGAGSPSGQVVFVVGGVAQPAVPVTGGVATLVITARSAKSTVTVNVSAEFQSSNTDTWANSTGKGSYEVS